MTDDTTTDDTDAQPAGNGDPTDSGGRLSFGNAEEDGFQPEGDHVQYDRPRMNTKFWKQLFRTRNYLKKREKLIGDGYVEWVLVGDTVTREFIKPSREGGGIPQYEHDGNTYLFPRQSLVPNDDGMWTCVHREGEADPVPIHEPSDTSIPADVLKEYLDRSVSTSPPGLWDSLGIDSGDFIKIAIAGIIVFALLKNTGMI